MLSRMMINKRRTVLRVLLPVALVPLLSSCSVRQVVDIATSRNPERALSSTAKSRVASYKHNPVALVQDIQTARSQFLQLRAFLEGKAGQEWGRAETVTPSNTRYVKYTQNYQSRAIIQFDQGLVTVETVDEKAPERSLRNAIVTTLLTPDDPRAVDLFSARTIELSGRPYLAGLVADQNGRTINGPADAERFADYLVRNRMERRPVHAEAGTRTAHAVRFSMVSDYQSRQAQRYAPLVNRYAEAFGVSRSLIYAVMQTESSFNPYAVSTAPAYGLMQLVPSTGGRDAYRYVKGYDHTPSKEYLFIPDNNVELGAAYLDMLQSKYLGQIRDPVSREYCIISAYNGGAGNVLQLFHPDRQRAVAVINSLSPAEVYSRLRDEHPRAETRRYLVKVLNARRRFVSL